MDSAGGGKVEIRILFFIDFGDNLAHILKCPDVDIHLGSELGSATG